MRETDDGPTEKGIALLRSRITRFDAAFKARLAAGSMRLACYSNAQKNGHMRDRVRMYAAHAKQR
eukprot:gene3061-6310_t